MYEKVFRKPGLIECLGQNCLSLKELWEDVVIHRYNRTARYLESQALLLFSSIGLFVVWRYGRLKHDARCWRCRIRFTDTTWTATSSTERTGLFTLSSDSFMGARLSLVTRQIIWVQIYQLSLSYCLASKHAKHSRSFIVNPIWDVLAREYPKRSTSIHIKTNLAVRIIG